MTAVDERLDPATRQLLLLAARESCNEAQQARAIQLVAEVRDWDRFCGVSANFLGAGLVHRSLASLPAGTVPDPVIARIRNAARMYALRSLGIESALLDFKTECLDALGVRHAFFKGAALAHRYYQSPALRAYRDVDVLIDQEHALELLRHALARGYTLAEYVRKGDRALAAWVRNTTVYPLHAPNGMRIEVHRLLDDGDRLFDTGRILSRAESITFHGRPLPVLRTADLFAYVCVHHTRHFWSHLHWYADLDVLSRHPLFDMAEVRQAVQHAGIGATLEACLRLHQLGASGNWPEPLSPVQGPGEALLLRSMECLEGGLEYEHALRETRLSTSHAFGWQVTGTRQAVLLVRRGIKRTYRRTRNLVANTLKAALPERLVAWIRQVRS